jgi:acetoin utilization protein AcuB
MVMVRRIRHIPILDAQQRLVGIVTDRDIKRTLPSPLVSSAREEYEALLETTAISRVMSPDPMTVDADSDVADAVELLVQNRIGGLPVMENDTLVGVFTERDALRGYVELLQALQKAEAAG